MSAWVSEKNTVWTPKRFSGTCTKHGPDMYKTWSRSGGVRNTLNAGWRPSQQVVDKLGSIVIIEVYLSFYINEQNKEIIVWLQQWVNGLILQGIVKQKRSRENWMREGESKKKSVSVSKISRIK